MIMIEQSAKLALEDYAFAANDEATWAAVTSMMTSFLTNLWQEGALAGASPAAAFSVSVGLGKTMTATDILNGIMTLVIKVAITHPVEFIVITISQKMQIS
jgi:phage tail sheath protein FI